MQHTIYSPDNFHKIIDCERIRAERNSSKLGLIILTFIKNNNYDTIMQEALLPLSNRLRCYDVIGWLDYQRIGIVLPGAPDNIARKLAESICSTILPPHLSTQYTLKVMCFPTRWMTHPENNSLSAAQAREKLPETYFHPSADLRPLFRNSSFITKRILDLALVVPGLIIISPLMALIAIFIKTVSPGPVFFKQKRVGYLGKPFTCWKFRTMKTDAETNSHKKHFCELIQRNKTLRKLDNQDSRIIPFGVILRKSGLDELPQLFNVLSGEMSLIGPRPCIPYEASEFSSWQHKRFEILPGLTGLWQVNGKNRTTFFEMMRLDINYVLKRSLWLDLKIILKTCPAIIKQLCE